MAHVPTPPPDGAEVHFLTFTQYSCGDTIGRTQSDHIDDVTCQICRSQYELLTDPRFADAAVVRAVDALKAFGDYLNREQAGVLLGMWSGRASLTQVQAALVIAYFPARR